MSKVITEIEVGRGFKPVPLGRRLTLILGDPTGKEVELAFGRIFAVSRATYITHLDQLKQMLRNVGSGPLRLNCIENGLHPIQQQYILSDMLIRKPTTQFIIKTFSDIIVDSVNTMILKNLIDTDRLDANRKDLDIYEMEPSEVVVWDLDRQEDLVQRELSPPVVSNPYKDIIDEQDFIYQDFKSVYDG